MKIYVGGSFSCKGQVKLFVQELINMGHEITYDWTQVPAVDKNHDVYSEAAGKAFKGIQECDLYIGVFSNGKDRFRGVFTEIGIALGMGKKVFLFNSDNMSNLTWLPSDRIETNIYYHFEPHVTVYTQWVDLVLAIKKLS